MNSRTGHLKADKDLDRKGLAEAACCFKSLRGEQACKCSRLCSGRDQRRNSDDFYAV